MANAKVSLIVEDALAGLALLAFVVFGTPAVLSLEVPAPQAELRTTPSPNAEPAAPVLSMPLPYDAVVCQDKCRFYVRSDK